MHRLPDDAPFLMRKLLGLLRAGVDVHVHVDTPGVAPDGARLAGPEGSELHRRVHAAWPTRPAWLPAVLLPFALLKTTALHARAVWRFFRHQVPRLGVAGALRRFYVDAEILARRPSVVHFEYGTLALGRMHLGRTLACPTVVSFRGFDLNFAGLDRPDHFREVWSEATALHFLGRDLRDRAIRRGCAPDHPHVLIPPAIDVELFQRTSPRRRETTETAPRPLRFLSVGRLVWKKGYEYALEALAMVKGRGVEFSYAVVGDGDMREALTFAAEQLDVADRVEFLGWRTPDEVRRLMEESDVFVHAAVSEGFCNAVVEAQAMELPVVTSDADGLGENVEDGVTGFVTPRRRPGAMADVLVRLAADPGLRGRMGRAGRERVLTRFRIQDQIAAFATLYDSLGGQR